jgi:hypothetical protein
LELARRDYLAAFDADPADSVPAIRLMELETQVVLNLVKSSAFLPTISPGGDNVNSPEWTAFRAAAKEALARRPGSFRLEWRWGVVATADAQRGDHRLWEEAMLHLDEARYLYPTNTRVLADLAVAQRAVGRMAEARGVARTAIQLDDLNRQRGHTDRWLTEEVRKSLEQFSNEAR